MNKLILVLIIPVILTLKGFNVHHTIDNQFEEATSTKMSFSDLNDEQKAEALAYFKATGNCEYKGIKLYGKVQYVTSFPDIKIKYVESFPDIKVKFVTSFPDDCGEWQIVESFPDFKVQVVESFPDLEVKIVESFPGME